MQTTRTHFDLAAFTEAARAEVQRNDHARLHAELLVAADFDRWSDEFWSGYVSGPSERVA